MSYFHKRGALHGLGDASSCGAGQQFYPNVTFAGVKGQCMTPAQYETCKSSGSIFGSPCKVEDTLTSVASSFLASLLPKPPPAQTTTMVVQQPAGMSTTTKVALAGGAVLLVALLARR